MFSYVSLEGRIPKSHPLRKLRLLVERIDDNLLYRWFVGLASDDPVWDHSTFSHNRDRLFNEGLARVCFERVRALADWQRWTSSEHFSVDGTLIDAWASHIELPTPGR